MLQIHNATKYKIQNATKRQGDAAIVQRQEFAHVARAGRGKAARNVLPKKDAGPLL